MKSKIPKELLFLSSLYSGWNSKKITREQFVEMENKLHMFPAASLAKKLDNRNLIGLKKKPYKIGIHKQLMAVLRRKYGFEDKPGVTRTVQQEMDLLKILDFIQKTVQESLYEPGKDNQINVNSYNLLLEQEGVNGQGSCYEFIAGLKHLNKTELCAKIWIGSSKIKVTI